MCEKINNIFNSKHVNELAVKYGDVKEEVEEEDKFNIILNLHQE